MSRRFGVKGRIKSEFDEDLQGDDLWWEGAEDILKVIRHIRSPIRDLAESHVRYLTTILTAINREALETAKHNGYLVIHHRDLRSELNLRKAWFYWTESQDIPDIRIEVRRAYATVSMDLEYNSYRLTRDGVNAAERAFLRCCSDNTLFGCKDVYVYHPRISIKDAPGLAKELAEIAALDQRPGEEHL